MGDSINVALRFALYTDLMLLFGLLPSGSIAYVVRNADRERCCILSHSWLAQLRSVY